MTLPVMLAAGAYAIPRAQRQERALWRREMRHWRQARRDPLTGAHNRLAVQEFINRQHLDRPRAMAALFVLDLHEFQRINDACGHQVGDEVLREVCRRLHAVAFQYRSADAVPNAAGGRQRHPQVVRVGSDELGLWFADWPEGQAAQSVAGAMLAALDEPFEVAGLRLHVQGAVGYVVQAIGESSGSDWLTRVNAALQEAKRQGVGRQVAFEHRHIEAMVKRHEMQQALRDAVRHGEGFSLEYQPIVSIELGTLMGCEALLRWHHPRWGQVPPSAFIPVAEGSDLIRPLGRWVLSRAIEQMAAWRDQVPAAAMLRLKMSVNLSRAQLHDPLLVPHIQALLDAHDLPASALRLEVTESLPLDDAQSLATLERLRVLGTSVALDDFGTGYSSLAALLNLPIRSVKIDRHFVSGIDQCPYRQALVSGVVRVAQLMELEVVAEGIEQPAEAEKLRQIGCHQIQGWYVSRALPADAFAQRWLQRADASEPSDSDSATPSGRCSPQQWTRERFGRCPSQPEASSVAPRLSVSSSV